MEKENSMLENETSEIKLNEMIGMAKNNQDEDWVKIDSELGNYANDNVFVEWAKNSLKEPDSGVKDLAASILEKSECSLSSLDISNLKGLMEIADKNPYPSFRAACALAKRHDEPDIKLLSGQIIQKLEEFAEDNSVSDIAKKYLDLMKIGD